MLRVGTVKIEKAKQLPSVREGRGQCATAPLRFCVSCPDLVPVSRTRFCASPVYYGLRTRSISHAPLALLFQRSSSLPCLVPAHMFHTSKSLVKSCSPPCSCGCPCPFPCGPCGCPNGCNCLPPPCNQPPKCIQYMTGYYYYPYGFWFCGPYHVTGTCTPVGPCGPCPSAGPSCPPCPCAKCCACFSPVAAAAVSSSAQQRGPVIQRVSRPLQSPNADLKYPLPSQDSVQCSTAAAAPQPTPPNRSANTGISKFFPFNSVPSVEPLRRLPHTSVLMCPYSTQPTPSENKASSFPEHRPVYCTPCIKQQKNNFSNRARQNFSNNCQKPKKSVPNSLSKSYSDYYEKRTESRSPIHHRRPKRLNCEVCPLLESPRGLMSQEQRDNPKVFPGAFQYANIPNYKSPYPQPITESTFKAYDA